MLWYKLMTYAGLTSRILLFLLFPDRALPAETQLTQSRISEDGLQSTPLSSVQAPLVDDLAIEFQTLTDQQTLCHGVLISRNEVVTSMECFKKLLPQAGSLIFVVSAGGESYGRIQPLLESVQQSGKELVRLYLQIPVAEYKYIGQNIYFTALIAPQELYATVGTDSAQAVSVKLFCSGFYCTYTGPSDSIPSDFIKEGAPLFYKNKILCVNLNNDNGCTRKLYLRLNSAGLNLKDWLRIVGPLSFWGCVCSYHCPRYRVFTVVSSAAGATLLYLTAQSISTAITSFVNDCEIISGNAKPEHIKYRQMGY